MWSSTARKSQIIQLDNGPALKGNESVHPISDVRLQSANAYTERTAGPIKTATIDPNCWAVFAAQAPVRDSPAMLLCEKAPIQVVTGWTRSTFKTVRGSDMVCTPVLWDFDALGMPKVTEVPGEEIPLSAKCPDAERKSFKKTFRRRLGHSGLGRMQTRGGSPRWPARLASGRISRSK